MKKLFLSILFALSGRRYIPIAGLAFCDWVENAVGYCRENCARWGVEPPEEGIEDSVKELRQRVLDCKDSPNKVDVVQKNALHKELDTYIRKYLQGTVARNAKVTEADRKAIGLNEPDPKPTPIGEPVGLPGAKVNYLYTGTMELHIVHDEGEYDPRANYGVRIVYDVFPLSPDVPIPSDIKLLQRSMFTRRKKQVFHFEKDESRKTAVFCLRYENSKGQAGGWGAIISAVIP